MIWLKLSIIALAAVGSAHASGKKILKNIFQKTILNFNFTLSASGIKSPEANPDAKRLYDDLLSNYNRLIRPVVNNSETLTVYLGLKLSQLIEVNLKNQVMTTNLWVPQVKIQTSLKNF